MCGSEKKARKTPLTHCWATVKLYTLSFHRTIRLSALPELTQGCCLPVCPVCQNQTGTRVDHWSCLAWSSFLSLNHCSTLNWKQKMGDQLQTYRCPKRTKKQTNQKKSSRFFIYIYYLFFLTFITWVNKVNLPQVLVNLHPLVQDSFYY